MSNLKWGFTSSSTCGSDCPDGTNKYDQHYISTQWTDTDAHGETYVGDLKSGLNSATAGKRPADFVYAYTTNMAWADFHGDLVMDVWWWHMPLAPRVDPRHSGSQYYLYSWRGNPGGDYGHWITLRGYQGDPGDQATSRAYYNDSSGGRDEHDGTVIYGSTGAFDDKSYTVWKTMTLNQTGGLYYLIW